MAVCVDEYSEIISYCKWSDQFLMIWLMNIKMFIVMVG
jgi:hypothetical protein